MMRCPGKRTATVLSAAVMLALIAGCGSTSPTATPPTAPPRSAGLAQILQRGTVRVCSTGDYRPFTFRDPQGNWSGLDIEMAHDMAARLGVQLDVVPTTWAHLVDDLDNKCDVAMGGILGRSGLDTRHIGLRERCLRQCFNVGFYGFEYIDYYEITVAIYTGGSAANYT